MTVQLTQDSLIEALRALRQDHPELPAISWEISPYSNAGLRGHAYTQDRDLEVLEAYATVIGGSIRPAIIFNAAGVDMQSFALHGRWADVPFHLSGSVTVSSYAASLRERLAVAS